MTIKLTGIFAALTTPFDQTGEVAYDKLESNLRRWNTTRLSGYLVLGSTGEFPHLTTSEKLALIEGVRRLTPSGKLLLAGTGELSTRQTIEMTRAAAERGADAAVVVTPFYYRKILDQERFVEHYWKIADVSNIPIVVYVIPQFSGVTLLPQTIASLAEHPNIIGLKESSGDIPALRELFEELRTRNIGSEKFRVMVGAPAIYKQAVEIGAAGGVLAVACVAPQACCALDQCVRQGDERRAAALQERLADFSRKTTVNGIGHIKAAMDMTGFYGSTPRLPLSAPTEGEIESIAQAVAVSGFFHRDAPGQAWMERTGVE
jgi:4-hydroxy-2-oxoglutarate aldolase